MVDELHVGDFVRAEGTSGNHIAGTVVGRDDRANELQVDVYGPDGATGTVRTVDMESAELHPVGRESVMEDINNGDEYDTHEDY